MNTAINENEPQDDWSLEQLSEFCGKCRKRMAIDGWQIGKAIVFAKARCIIENKSFTDWKSTNGFSDASASRLRRIYERYQTAEELAHLSEIGLLAAYIEAGVEAPRPRVPRQASRRNKAQGAPSWALPEDDTPLVAEDDDPENIALLPIAESVREELCDGVPAHVAGLKERLQFVLDQGDAVIRAGWPVDSARRQEIAADITEVSVLLRRLAATLVPRGSRVKVAKKSGPGKDSDSSAA